MKNQRRSTILARLSGALLVLALAACSSGVKLEDNQGAPVEDRTGSAVTRPGGATGQPGGSTGQSTPANTTRDVARVDTRPATPPVDPTTAQALRSVYFEFDSFVVGEKFRPAIEAHAKFLIANKGRKVTIQGNADERGGSEYNLALGQKRAEAVRRAISLLGVPEAQMEAVSLGKEKPKALGHDEAAWAENRRADLVYQ